MVRALYVVLYCTVVIFALAARALFEGVIPSNLTRHALSSRNLIMEGESLACQLSCVFEVLAKLKKMLLTKVI